MTASRLLSTMLFGAAILVSGWLAARAPQATDAHAPTRETWDVLPPAGSLSYAIPAGAGDLSLATRRAPAQATAADACALHLTWRSPAGTVVHEQTLHDRGGTPTTRTTRVPGGALLPQGGTLLVASAKTRNPVVLQVQAQARAVDPDPPDTLARRADLPAAWLLGPAEVRLLERATWDRLAPREPDAGAWSPPAPVDDARQAAIVLPAGRSIAVNVVAPLSLRLSGAPGTERLALARVPEPPGASPSPDPDAAALDRVVGFPGEASARAIALPGTGPVSLHLSNPTDRAVGPFWITADALDPAGLFGQPRVHVLTRPDGGRVAALAPETHAWTGWRTGPDDPGALHFTTPGPRVGGLLRLDISRLLTSPTDAAPLEVVVEAQDASGSLVWKNAHAVALAVDPFDVPTHADASRWVSEPGVLYLSYQPGVERISVRTLAPAVVTAWALGPATGSTDPSPPTGVRLLHAPDASTRWHRLDPPDAAARRTAGHAVDVEAQTRLVLPATAPPAGPLHFATIPPRGAAPEQAWLVEGDGTTPDTWYCAYAAGAPEAGFLFGPAARRLFRGVLEGFAFAPRAARGTPFTLLLDGKAWKSGRFSAARMPVHGREPGHRTAGLVAAPGATLWLRTWGTPGEACPRAHREIVAWPLEPGESVTFDVVKSLPVQRFLVGGLARGEVVVQVEVDQGRPTRVPGLLPGITMESRELDLPPTQVTGFSLDEPARSRNLLDTGAIQLGPDLAAGRHEITVTNVSRFILYLQAAAEVPAGGDYTMWRAARLAAAGGAP